MSLAEYDAASSSDLEILRPLSHGLFAKVFLARSPTSPSSLFALKVAPFREKPQFTPEMARKEKRALQIGAENPFIVHCYDDFLEAKGCVFLLEFMPGGSLEQRLKAGMTWTEGEVKRLLGHVFAALKFLHTHEILHNDVQEANILLDSTLSIAKLCDFGHSCSFPEAEDEESPWADFHCLASVLEAMTARGHTVAVAIKSVFADRCHASKADAEFLAEQIEKLQFFAHPGPLAVANAIRETIETNEFESR